MKILVTGGLGYIGSVLVPELLRAGHLVTVLDLVRRPVGATKFVRGDVRNLRMLLKDAGDFDAAIHLAALRLPECKYPTRAESVNVLGTTYVAEWCEEREAKLLFASSCSVYGFQKGLIDEATPPAPTTLYAETKVRGEKSVLAAGGTVLRLATVYGPSPNPRWDTIVNGFVKDAARDNRVMVFSPAAWRPVLHVDDASAAFLAALEKGAPGEIYNVGEQNVTKGDLVDCLKKHFRNLEVITNPEIKEPRSYRVSFSKALDDLGFNAEHNVRTDMLDVLC